MPDRAAEFAEKFLNLLYRMARLPLATMVLALLFFLVGLKFGAVIIFIPFIFFPWKKRSQYK